MADNRSHFDGARVLADLNTLRGIGAYKTGVHKPTFSEAHMRSLQWLAERLPEAGLAATIDGIGNVVGTSTKSGPKLLAGSHLESQNYAGWLDGPLGVVYALEAARVINPDAGAKGAVEVAVWCDEEGHFGTFLGSRSYVGGVTEDEIDAARDRSSGRSMREALRDVGLAGRRAHPSRTRAAYRISRGPYRARPHARKRRSQRSASSPPSSASGNTASASVANKITPARRGWRFARMPAWRWRRFCVAIDDRFPELCGPRTVWTTGRITLDPGAPSIIPGHAEMLFQIRDDDPGVIGRLEGMLRSMAAEVTAQGRCHVAVERIRTGAPALMDARISADHRSRKRWPLPAAGRSACPAAPVTTRKFSPPSCHRP